MKQKMCNYLASKCVFGLSLLFNIELILKHVSKPENPDILSIGRPIKENQTEFSEKMYINFIIFKFHCRWNTKYCWKMLTEDLTIRQNMN